MSASSCSRGATSTLQQQRGGGGQCSSSGDEVDMQRTRAAVAVKRERCEPAAQPRSGLPLPLYAPRSLHNNNSLEGELLASVCGIAQVYAALCGAAVGTAHNDIKPQVCSRAEQSRAETRRGGGGGAKQEGESWSRGGGSEYDDLPARRVQPPPSRATAAAAPLLMSK